LKKSGKRFRVAIADEMAAGRLLVTSGAAAEKQLDRNLTGRYDACRFMNQTFQSVPAEGLKNLMSLGHKNARA
jgi:hypothetical protein